MKQKYKITATSKGFVSSRVSTVRYTHAVCQDNNGIAVFWSKSLAAAEAKARTNHIVWVPKHVVETAIEEIG
jgi:hypothetical protein